MESKLNLFLATSNAGKIKELKAQCEEKLRPTAYIKRGCNLDILSCKDFDNYEEPIETGITYKENALIKAYAAARVSGYCSIADDSGLIVEIMGKAPGVLSARWSGEDKNDQANRKLLLRQLKDVSFIHRKAYFSTCVACVIPQDSSLGNVVKQALKKDREKNSTQDKKYECIIEKCIDATYFYEMSFMGTMNGYILYSEQGEDGFGYDSIFAPNKINPNLDSRLLNCIYCDTYSNRSDKKDSDCKRGEISDSINTTTHTALSENIQLMSCAQITLEQKNAISHRAQAFNQLFSMLMPLILEIVKE